MTHAKRAITVEDLWALKRFGASSLSPDGRWACVPVSTFDMQKNDSSSQLWLVSTDGKSQRQLTRGQKDSDPQWSPDGRWIAFTSRRGSGKEADDNAQLYVIAPEGGEARRVMALATGVASLRWFPDSRRIAFVSWVWPELHTTAEQARRFKEDKDDKVRAIVAEHNNTRYWDHWFARGRMPHVHSVVVASGRVTDHFAGTPFHLLPQDPDANSFDISPDGKELVFTCDFETDPQRYWLTDLVALDIGTPAGKGGKSARSKWRRLTDATGRRGGCASDSPRYSPDGRWIAFLCNDYQTLYNAQARLWLLDRNTGKARGLTQGWDRGVTAPLQWRADSTGLCFTAEDGVAQPVWQMALAAPADTSPVELLRGPAHGGVATDLRISRDGTTLVFARSSHSHPPQLFAAGLPSGPLPGAAPTRLNERLIDHFNDRLMKPLQLGHVQSMQISGHGGDAVQMWLVAPPLPGKAAKASGKKPPLMHVIHGGPHTCSNDAWHWRWNTQLLAAAGYCVAAVNYHGSTGWGQQFVSSINGDWGPRELADIEAGTDHLLALGLVDPKRIVATGGSYGGYMVAYMNGRVQSDRYRAYVCHAGCYDWVAMMASDGYLWFGQELGAFHWDDEARVLRQSPHHYAADFKTPTLVIHGELDFRVPVQQGLAYYNTLRARQIPARLVYFPDENHWILKPQNSRLWYGEFIGWCNRHIGTSSATANAPAGRKKAGQPA